MYPSHYRGNVRVVNFVSRLTRDRHITLVLS